MKSRLISDIYKINRVMKTIYDPGWKVVWRIYSKENLKKSVCLPLILTVVTFVICFISEKSPLYFIEYVASTILSVGPNMLGFTLSGYALMMGLSNSEFIQGLINFKEKGKEYSLFQSLNAVFAVVLGMMFLTTIVGAFVSVILKAKISLPYELNGFTDTYNWFSLFLLMFLMFYTINAIKDIVINIFNFGQYVQLYAESSNEEDEN